MGDRAVSRVVDGDRPVGLSGRFPGPMEGPSEAEGEKRMVKVLKESWKVLQTCIQVNQPSTGEKSLEPFQGSSAGEKFHLELFSWKQLCYPTVLLSVLRTFG